jgi:hypothetical protein
VILDFKGEEGLDPNKSYQPVVCAYDIHLLAENINIRVYVLYSN